MLPDAGYTDQSSRLPVGGTTPEQDVVAIDMDLANHNAEIFQKLVMFRRTSAFISVLLPELWGPVIAIV